VNDRSLDFLSYSGLFGAVMGVVISYLAGPECWNPGFHTACAQVLASDPVLGVSYLWFSLYTMSAAAVMTVAVVMVIFEELEGGKS